MKEESFRLSEKIALLENELITVRSRMQNIQSIILSNISHDIRTPMNAIVGFANLLAVEKMDEKEREECIDQINTNSVELLEIIDNMIDASMLQCGNIKLYEKECYLNDLLDNLYISFRELTVVKQKKLNLMASKGDEDDYFLITDFKRLKQIFHNLLKNAIQFTDNGHVEFGYEKLRNRKIRFFVKDTGSGLESMAGEDLFQPFRSDTDSEKGSFKKGAGLGLAISKSLVQLMGGEIWHKSIPGEGTCINFVIPEKRNSSLKSKLKYIRKITRRNIASIF